ncbi:DUF2971 domain-containing protein [Flagellimonas pacifica]|uniref:DUF2971 domain-containing protein n=1 Tax=Flagellimonas pacifica TaxID=1247520 RepID=A0A285MWX1_9FLAO|nr:DUF2971 domain-containing protein [Allomuricauda parva]SNZ01674.1 Protein of unknown function [Allomuricauda parva]
MKNNDSLGGDRKRNYDLTDFDTRNLDPQDVVSLLPKRIFKYFSINDNTLDVIRHGRLWYSSPKAFNDPFDCKVRIDFGTNKSEILKNLNDFLPDDLGHLWSGEEMIGIFDDPKKANTLLNQIFSTGFNDHLGVCCFSEIPNIPLMWSHYASSHSGICLEFGMETPNFIRENLIPVNYYSEYPEFVLSENSGDLYMFLMQLIASKSHDWDYEFEWRSITEEGGNRLYGFDKASLKGIIFGVNTSEEHMDGIKELISKSGYRDVQFKKAVLDDKRFGLKIM